MQMTAEEICRHYTQASNKSKDIQVLADLNVTDKPSIRAILIDGGVLPPDPPKRGRKPRADKPAEAPPAAPPKRPRKPAAEAASAQAAATKAPPPDASVYNRVEAILAAVPPGASEQARVHAHDLTMPCLWTTSAGGWSCRQTERRRL